MGNIVTVGYVVEGTTDVKFLGQVIRRTFEHVAFDCLGEIEVFEPELMEPIGATYVKQLLNASVSSFEIGLQVLCIHADSDSPSANQVLERKLDPAFTDIQAYGGDNCKNLVAVIPIHMSEAWILADVDILREEIGTTLSATHLALTRSPESYADPKMAIENAVRLARAGLTRRRRGDLTLADLYQILGQRVRLERLERLGSYLAFKGAVVDAYRRLGFLH